MQKTLKKSSYYFQIKEQRFWHDKNVEIRKKNLVHFLVFKYLFLFLFFYLTYKHKAKKTSLI